MSQIAAGNTRFNVTAYKPEGGFRPLGLLNLITTLVVVGGVLGFAAHYIGRFFYLIILFPAGIGLVLGLIGAKMVKSGHIRNPWLGALAGFLGGALAMLMMHYFDYTQFKSAMLAQDPELTQILQLNDQEQIEISQAFEDPADFLLALRAMKSFPGFVDFSARQGVEISNHGSKGLNLGYYGSYIYWIVELLIVAGITLFMVREGAAAPYCTSCGEWKTAQTLGAITKDPASAATGVSSGDAALIAAAEPDSAAVTSVMLYAALCGKCCGQESSMDVKLVEFQPQKDGKTKEITLAHACWPGEAQERLKAVCTRPKAADAPVETAPN